MIQFLLIFSDWGILILRVALGLILIVQGWPKIKNLRGTAENFSGMGFKPGFFWGTLVAFLEFFGGIGLVVGFFTQLIALFVALQFIVIILKLKHGKILASGVQFDLLIVAAALILVTLGSGAFSLERFLGFVFY